MMMEEAEDDLPKHIAKAKKQQVLVDDRRRRATALQAEHDAQTKVEPATITTLMKIGWKCGLLLLRLSVSL